MRADARRRAAQRGAGVRLLWQTADGADHFADFPALSLAREAVTPEMADWVIVERTVSGRYATVGEVLDSIDD